MPRLFCKAMVRCVLWLAVGVMISSCFGEIEKHTFCVAAGTRISTPSGPKPVETLVVGSIVWSIDPSTGTRVEGRVTAVATARQSVVQVTSPGGHRLRATSSHPVYDASTGRYVPLGEWAASSRALVLDHGSVLEAAVIQVEPFGRAQVFDVSIDSPYHNFLAEGFVVHNKQPPYEGPYTVQDFRLETVTDTVATFVWTVPGGVQGPTDRFIVRVWSQTSSIDAMDWVTTLSQPSVGDTVRVNAHPLRAGTSYDAMVVSSYEHAPVEWMESFPIEFDTLP